jgi:hypothetical protein
MERGDAAKAEEEANTRRMEWNKTKHGINRQACQDKENNLRKGN